MRLGISKKVDYGLQLMTALAKEKGEEFVGLKRLAEKNKWPYKFLGQIARELGEFGIVESREGVGGGYRLAKSVDKISVAEVFEALEGKMDEHACIRGDGCECGNFCVQDEVFEPMAKAAYGVLGKQTVADLVRSKK